MKENKINPVNESYEKLNIYKDLVGEKIDDKIIYDIFNKCNVKHNRTNYVFSPIDIEIIMNNKEKVLEIIDRGINLNEVSYQKYTPLEVAISTRNYDMTKLLIEKGADVNLHSFYTPLNLAVSIRNYDIIKLLIEKGADINYRDEKGLNALHYLLDNGPLGTKRVDMIFSMIGYYYDIAKCYKSNVKTMTKEICDIIDLLYKNGIDVNCLGKSHLYKNKLDPDLQISPLSLVVERGDGVLTQKLLECGASKEVYELNPESIYSYQDSFNFIADIKDGDLSLWCDAPWEYLRFLKYKRNVIKYGIEVTATNTKLGYKRPNMIKVLKKD